MKKTALHRTAKYDRYPTIDPVPETGPKFNFEKELEVQSYTLPAVPRSTVGNF